ncbi:demethoxyubiquinone hydroxylase family protein [Yunchengibacter salinarum]|uniref:demethoxyubiquinone hydroxylase family protein n=1 Tax=Yunchengibacter salinarum TaxID=3133399 RepID=UPI0035B5A6F3
MTHETRRTAITETTAPPRPLPGDRQPDRDAMIRVDHAGEYGAVRIYAGQMAIFGDKHRKSGLIRHMKAQEDAHLARFNRLIGERGVRPTLLQPFWHVAGFALGAGTALMGEKAAMACTQAVETVIDDHYQEQRDQLAGSDAELEEIIEDFQAEEVEHKKIAEAHGANEAPGHPVLSGLIKAGCRAAIAVARRL